MEEYLPLVEVEGFQKGAEEDQTKEVILQREEQGDRHHPIRKGQ